MLVEQSEHFADPRLDPRCVVGAGADKPDPVHHARPHLLGEAPKRFPSSACRSADARDAPRRADLIDVARPAVVKHPFVAQLVAEFLDQCRNEARNGVVRVWIDGSGCSLSHRVDDRRGIPGCRCLRASPPAE